MRIIITKIPGGVVMEVQELIKLPESTGPMWVTTKALKVTGPGAFNSVIGEALWEERNFV